MRFLDLPVAFASTLGGVLIVYLAWRRAAPRSWPALTAGWIAVTLATPLWIRAAGVEFGVVYAAVALAFAAWLVIACGRDRPAAPSRRSPVRVAAAPPSRATVAGVLARTLVTVPLAGTASLLASVLFVSGLPWGTTNRYVFALLIAPIVWGNLSIWAATTMNLRRAAILFASASVVCAVCLFVR